MKLSALLLVVLASVPVAARAAPDAAAPVSTLADADQKLIDRYTAALGEKYGFAPWAVEKGSLTAKTAADSKTVVDIGATRSEEEIEVRILTTLGGKAAKREFGAAKSPIYFVGASAEDLFKGAVIAADATDEANAAAAAKAASNDFKAVLDLKQGKIIFPDQAPLEIVFKVDDKPARRVVLRRSPDGSALLAAIDGADYSFAAARVQSGGKTERDPKKSGAASAFFAMNELMQKRIKAADARAATANPRGLSDGGYKHPSFEKLMSQVKGGLTSDNLDKTFENAEGRPAADLQARAKGAQELIGEGYGAAAHWKINSNGKYEDKNGNLTLMVRTKDAGSGKIEETPVLIKKDSHGNYELSAAVAPVTKLLLGGDVVAARAQALRSAAVVAPADVAAEVKNRPADAAGPGALGFVGSAFQDLKPEPSPDPALKVALERRADAVRKETALQAQACDGKPECAKPAAVVRPSSVGPANPPLANNAMCAINIQRAPSDEAIIAASAESLEDQPWMQNPNGFRPIGGVTYAVALACVSGRNRGILSTAEDFARAKLTSVASCNASSGSPVAIVRKVFRLKQEGMWGECAQARLKTAS
jgi:hypothetical protein